MARNAILIEDGSDVAAKAYLTMATQMTERQSAAADSEPGSNEAGSD
jgi:hypothetical protein